MSVWLSIVKWTILFHGILSMDPDVHKDMVDIVAEKGYPIDEFYVTTEDGYILGVFRIPYGRNENENARDSGKPVVFLQHGLLDSSYTWVNNFPDESLGFLLADAGYDVWLGNNRGNTFSKHHTVYPTDSEQFWNFSYDEMARYDAPNQIDYVLEYTNKTKLAYVGHSEGTIQMFAAPTVRPDILDKVALFGALAPVAYVHHTKSPLIRLLAIIHLDWFYELFGRKQFLPGIYVLDKIDPLICQAFDNLCGDFLFLVAGPSQDLNNSRIEVYVSETPADTSVKNMAHWSQDVSHEWFEMYDYLTPEKNMEYYGSTKPPRYNLSAVTMPVALFSGTNDWLADPTDVAKLIADLPPASIINNTVVDGFAHLDFVWGVHANKYVYDPLMELIEQYIGPGKIVTK